ncbi:MULTISPECIES: TetR/AcrR family transcriptional regulator [Actinoalloteichus]|uniref:Transcriptional regulator, TetR family n=1 Tax=Actinoalloteichus fjordicus TaxID=1612552 RepID=A0AAC9PQR2_9PSEU|nr:MULTISPECIES: TetR/AcrR family transcriptional regulator [Actinoalloteichus]APU13429.1 transcriptional regulator, TetR family [Actinoalloteichus fjordicus]APU19378.1 transcriptional regulator, TetR family [Actinoalloteichus sp. GBA129-24]
METTERILDAAARVMREEGLAKTTTKEIARAAGCSEALLYKHFADKQEIFVRVLTERMPPIAMDPGMVGQGSVTGNLRVIVEGLLRFYAQSFPIAASIFSSPSLLAAHRESMNARQKGPHLAAAAVRSYLDAEIAAGRVSSTVDTDAVAVTLTGAAMFEAFLAAFAGHDEPAEVPALARRVVAVVAPALAG